MFVTEFTEPCVTIGLPVFNGSDFISEAIASVQAQTLTNWTLVIADNGSSDDTLEIATAAAQDDPRIIVLPSPENHGAAWNYNRVVDAATTPYFRWAAHDDLIEPDYLQACVDALEADPNVVLAYPQTRIIDAEGQVVGAYDDNYNLMDDRPSKRFRRHLFSARFECNAVFGVFRTDFLKASVRIGSYPGSDFVMLGNAALAGKVCEVNRPLFKRRDHAATSIRANPSTTALQAWFGKREGRGRAIRPAWTKLNRYHQIVSGLPIGFGEKLSCYIELAKWMRWFWRDLAGDYFPIFNNAERRRVLKGAIPVPEVHAMEPGAETEQKDAA